MAGIKISQLPALGAPALTDITVDVQPASGGTTFQMTWQQLLTLFQPNIPLTNAGNPNGSVAGTQYQFLLDTTNSVLYICTSTGSSSTAVWTAQGGTGAFLPLSGGTMSGNIAMGSNSITGLANPVGAQDAATKNYVDNIATGGGQPVFAATTANLNATYSNGVSGVGATLTNAGALTAFTVDGQSPSSGARILVKNQSTNTQNGVYTLTTVGSGSVAWVLTRAIDYDTPTDINDTGIIPVENGTVNANTGWINTTVMVTVGTTAVTFVQFGASLPLSMANGGTGANLTAANGAIPYSGSSTMALLAPGSSGQLIQSGGAGAPNWTTTTYPTTNAINTIMYASSANVLGSITPVNSAVLISSAGGVPSWNTSLPSGIGINATSVLKSGSAGGDYTTTSASYTDVDGTNLAYTVTVPTGYKIHVECDFVVYHSVAGDTINVALTDGTTNLATQVITGPNVNYTIPGSISYLFNGDGNSHTFKLRWLTNGATANMCNGTLGAGTVPRMKFLMLPSS